MADVSTPRAEYTAMLPRWELVRDLIGGEDAMKLAGVRWLPIEPRESSQAYEVRKARSSFFPAYQHTIEQLVAAMFEQEVDVSGVAAPLRPFLDNIDLQGNNITVFLRAVARKAAAYGMSHIYVTAPRVEPGATLADERDQGVRPYLVHRDPMSVISWRQAEGADRTLQSVRMTELDYRPSDQFDDSTYVNRIRVVTRAPFPDGRAQWQVWEKVTGTRDAVAAAQGGWRVVDQGLLAVPFVPLVPVYTGMTGFMTASPPLMPLAHLNVTHWQSSSDQRNILRMARVPFLFGSGISEEEMDGDFTIGPNRILIVKDPSAKLGWVEHSSEAISAGERDIATLEERMRQIGARVLDTAKKSGSPTATAQAIDTSEATVSIREMAKGIEDAVNQALFYMAQYIGQKDGGRIEIKIRDATEKMIDTQKAMNEAKASDDTSGGAAQQ